MCKLRGWSPASKQPEKYARLTTDDVDEYLQRRAGIALEERSNPDKLVKCARCKEINPGKTSYCMKCGMPFDSKTTESIEAKDGNVLMEFMELMKREPRLLDMMKGITQSAETKELK